MTRLNRKRTVLKAGAVIAFVALLSACASSPAEETENMPSSAPMKDTLVFSYSNGVQQVAKVPMAMALEGMNKDGFTTEELFNQNPADAVQQVAQGDADFGTAASSAVFAAIKQGVPITAIMTTYRPDYAMVAPISVKDPGGLDGMRVGIHSQVSGTALYTSLAMADYPDAKPEMLVVAGSANRVQAMLAGELDASVLQTFDWLVIDEKAPGKFHVIYDVAPENPDIIDGVIFANNSLLQTDPEYVRNFIAAVQTQYAAVAEDQEALAAAISSMVPGQSVAQGKVLAPLYIENNIWPVDGAFSDNAIQVSLDAMAESGLLAPEQLPTLEECCTAEFLEQGK